MKATREPGGTDALRKRFDKRSLWTTFLRMATHGASISKLEADLWVAAAWYADSPTLAAELELKRAARAYGIELPAERTPPAVDPR